MHAYLRLLQVEVTAFHPLGHKRVTFATRWSQRLVSVALFRASRRTAVNRHPALWSPDLPPAGALTRQPATVWSASRDVLYAWIQRAYGHFTGGLRKLAEIRFAFFHKSRKCFLGFRPAQHAAEVVHLGVHGCLDRRGQFCLH